MVDFLKAAKQTATETLNVAGHKVIVRGLPMKELFRISKGKEKDPELLMTDLIAACCYDTKGNLLIPANRKNELEEINPTVFTALSGAISRVNGLNGGNSNATDGSDSSTD